MNVYEPLRNWLLSVTENSLVLSFEDIEGVIERTLPRSAYDYDAWWSNENAEKTAHVQSKAWTIAGFNAEVDRGRRQVTFRRR